MTTLNHAVPMRTRPDWLAFKMATGLPLEEMDALAKQVGFTINSPFITPEQAERFEAACIEAGLRKP